MTTTVKPTQTAFIRLDGRIGWRQDLSLSENLYIDSAGTLRLGRAGVYPISPTEPFGSFGGNTLPTGVAMHHEGRIVLADPENNRLLYYIPPFGQGLRPDSAADYWPFKPLWPESPAEENNSFDPLREPYRLSKPCAVTFSPAGDLVVADSGHQRILVFAWPGLQVRHILPLPGSCPVALVFNSKGYGFIADAALRCVHRFDSLWRLDDVYKNAEDILQKPIHLSIDNQDQLFVLDTALQKVLMLDSKGRVMRDGNSDLLTVEKMQLFERRYSNPALQLNNNALQYQHPCGAITLTGISVDKAGRLKGTSLPLLARAQRVALPRRGTYISERMDSEIDFCLWHRLTLDVTLQATTQLILQTFTSDIPLEPSRIAQLNGGDWSIPLPLTENDLAEVLIQSPAGRYLWLKIQLSGDGEQTPVIRSIEVQSPRRSSLQWLPPVFKNDTESAYFLDRLLSYSDTLFAEIQYEIEHFARLLDPYSVDEGEFLEWLGSWFDWQFLAEWPTSTRREMIASSISFYRQRGTVAGLKKILQWHTGLTGDQPQIIEHFRLRDYATRRVPGEDLIDDQLYVGGRPLAPEATNFAHWFTIVIPFSAVSDTDKKAALIRLVEAQKPAHTAYQLRIIKPDIRVACQSTIGVDMWLGAYPVESLGELNLGQSSRLADTESRGYQLESSYSKLTYKAEGHCL